MIVLIFLLRRILKIEPPIPDDLSPSVKDFICKLLVKEPRQRLGGGPGDAEEVKSHPFFRVRNQLVINSYCNLVPMHVGISLQDFNR